MSRAESGACFACATHRVAARRLRLVVGSTPAKPASPHTVLRNACAAAAWTLDDDCSSCAVGFTNNINDRRVVRMLRVLSAEVAPPLLLIPTEPAQASDIHVV